MNRPLRYLTLLLVLLTAAIAAGAAAPPPAAAHEIGRAPCRVYQVWHSFVTNPIAGARMGRACRLKARAHNLSHPLPASEIPDELEDIRDCESGDRLADGSAVHGTHDYLSENGGDRGGISDASGAYQIMDATWGGAYGYGHAADAPPALQDRRALAIYDDAGGTPWDESRDCWDR